MHGMKPTKSSALWDLVTTLVLGPKFSGVRETASILLGMSGGDVRSDDDDAVVGLGSNEAFPGLGLVKCSWYTFPPCFPRFLLCALPSSFLLPPKPKQSTPWISDNNSNNKINKHLWMHPNFILSLFLSRTCRRSVVVRAGTRESLEWFRPARRNYGWSEKKNFFTK